MTAFPQENSLLNGANNSVSVESICRRRGGILTDSRLFRPQTSEMEVREDCDAEPPAPGTEEPPPKIQRIDSEYQLVPIR